jgi:hypothetical protein
MDNYASYNIKVAEIFGLHPAIYLSELMNINEKAVRKSKITGEETFTIDRKYIEKRTTLSKAEQLKIDQSFKEIGLLKVDNDNQNTMSLDITVLTTIMSGGKPLIKELKLITAKTSKNKRTKDEVIKDELKNHIQTTNPELYSAYCDWIDAVYAKQGWMSARSVKVAQKDIDDYSDRNLDVALKIIDIAATRGYREMEWAINVYKQDYEPTFRLKYTKQAPEFRSSNDLSEEVF